MASQRDAGAVIELLAGNEESICQLYTAYARMFPDHAAFWSGLAAEEMDHAAWIHRLAARTREGSLYINENRFQKEAIHSFGEYLKAELARAQGEDIPLVTALSIALSVEQALIERKYFEVFETDSVELKHLLHELANATEEHVRKVEEQWASHR